MGLCILLFSHFNKYQDWYVSIHICTLLFKKNIMYQDSIGRFKYIKYVFKKKNIENNLNSIKKY